LPVPEVKVEAATEKAGKVEAKSDEAKDDKPQDKKDAKPAEQKLRLRMALTEETIRYVGGNKLRFHHQVVRSMPGGVEGIELVAGQCQVNQTIDLAEVRSTLNEYLDTYAKGPRPFPNPLPEIGMKKLSLVAFVQDDSDKSVWHAVMLPVPPAK
jgi:hypothetical protein